MLFRSEVLAVDIDPAAVTATLDNQGRNGVSFTVATSLGDPPDEAPFDLAVANIGANTLVELAPDFPLALGHQAFAHAANLDWQGFEERRERIVRGVAADEPLITPFQFLSLSDDEIRIVGEYLAGQTTR